MLSTASPARGVLCARAAVYRHCALHILRGTASQTTWQSPASLGRHCCAAFARGVDVYQLAALYPRRSSLSVACD